LTSTRWDAGQQEFGILPEIWGTIYSSVLGVGLGSLFGVAVAIFLTQDYIPPRIELFIKNIVELLAAIPSVVYGLWGIFVVIPVIRPACEWLHGHLGCQVTCPACSSRNARAASRKDNAQKRGKKAKDGSKTKR
jgi:phosphate transport system permease protein